jgi:ketosteroid isomerase-like protein
MSPPGDDRVSSNVDGCSSLTRQAVPWVGSRRAATLLLALVGLAGCGAQERATAADDAVLRDTLAALIADAYDFSRPGAVDRMIALYSDRDRVVSASGGQITASADSVRAGILRFWEQAGRNMRDARWEWEEVHVDPLGTDAAVLTATWSIPHIAPDGRPHVLEGAWTAVFRRVGGEWKIVHEHLSALGD